MPHCKIIEHHVALQDFHFRIALPPLYGNRKGSQKPVSLRQLHRSTAFQTRSQRSSQEPQLCWHLTSKPTTSSERTQAHGLRANMDFQRWSAHERSNPCAWCRLVGLWASPATASPLHFRESSNPTASRSLSQFPSTILPRIGRRVWRVIVFGSQNLLALR